MHASVDACIDVIQKAIRLISNLSARLNYIPSMHQQIALWFWKTCKKFWLMVISAVGDVNKTYNFNTVIWF